MSKPMDENALSRFRQLVGPALLFLLAAAGAGRVTMAQEADRAELSPKMDENREYLLGVTPFLPPERLELTFAHMAARFSEVLGRKVHFRTSSTYGRHLERMKAGAYDFAIIEPFHFVQIDPETYWPLAVIPGTFRAVFVTLKNSPLTHVNELRGKNLAVGPRESGLDYLAASTLLEHDLVADEDLSVRHVDSPLSCLQQVLAGTAAACVEDPVTLERFADKMSAEMKVIGQTVGVPFGPLVANRRVPKAEQEAIRDLMMTWQEDPRNRLSVPGTQMPSLVPYTKDRYKLVFEIWRTLQER